VYLRPPPSAYLRPAPVQKSHRLSAGGQAVALSAPRGPSRAAWVAITALAAATIASSTLLLQVQLPGKLSYERFETPGYAKSERLPVRAQGWEAAEVDVYPLDEDGAPKLAIPVRTIPYVRTLPDRDSATLWSEASPEVPPEVSSPLEPEISVLVLKGIPAGMPDLGAEAAPDESGLLDEFKLREAAARLGEVGEYLWDVYRRVPTKKDRSGNFTWKDLAAAQRLGMSIPEYVIGGMDPKFQERLFNAGRAMDEAGLRWSMLSAFRDDYRQRLASGFKAGDSNSLHGGARRTGGYGHGRAIDITSADEDHEAVWKWIDANGSKFGLHRPMPGYDPAHIQSASDGVKVGSSWRKGRLKKGKGKMRGGKKTRLASR
jgi:hypothetical protein